MVNQIIPGDTLTVLKTLPDKLVHCCVTSPPYWNLRDYGVAGQLGLEPTPEEYVTNMVEVFREVRRVLRDEGTLWLNLGDCYAVGKPRTEDICLDGGMRYHNRQSKLRAQELKPKNLVGIPWRVAFALQADGWCLRSDIIWHKPNPMPESVTDRPTKSHEYIFLLSKSRKYYYDAEAIKEPAKRWTGQAATFERTGVVSKHIIPGQTAAQHRPNRSEKGKGPIGRGKQSYNLASGIKGQPQQDHSGWIGGDGETCNKRSVWTVATRPFPEAHFATFPQKLIEPCILAGCPREGITLDPFMGAGTTALVAIQLGRNYLGVELNPKYIKLAEKRISEVQIKMPLFGG